MDKSFLANFTTKPTPKLKTDFKVILSKDNPILDAITSDVFNKDRALFKKDKNMLDETTRQELLLKFHKNRPVQNTLSLKRKHTPIFDVPSHQTYKIKPIKRTKRLNLIPLLELSIKPSIDTISPPRQPNLPSQLLPNDTPIPSIPKSIPITSVHVPKNITIPISQLIINDSSIKDRLPKNLLPKSIHLSEYYMNNRQNFIKFINDRLLKKYKKELEEQDANASCDYDDDKPFSLMAHQKIVRDYINLYSPYRGLLLFHGLGSGKTCTSIAIAEGLKSSNTVMILTPASLRTNYIEELKKCGDCLYLKNQYWEFINTQDNEELTDILSHVLSIPTKYIKTHGGAWLVDVKKSSNYDSLDATSKRTLDQQINVMINHKYQFISYNGMRKTHLDELTQQHTINPFDHKVVIIDEAHNFISRIVNKINKNIKSSMFGDLYEYLKSATNCKIILLTGTPIINYPNEIAVLFNILRGYIKTWTFKLTIQSKHKVNLAFFQKMFKPSTNTGIVLDYIDYNPTSTTLTITRNPFGFINKTTHTSSDYLGVKLGEHGLIGHDEFESLIRKTLGKHKISIADLVIHNHTALPDKMDDFRAAFIGPTNIVKNMGMFSRRIMGLTSYFRSAQETLMPKFTKAKNLRVIHIPMSDYQFGVYEAARVAERKLESQNAKKKKKNIGKNPDLFDDAVSTYRIFSRAYCNFVFPTEHKRPIPSNTNNLEDAIQIVDEDLIDAVPLEQQKDENYTLELEEIENKSKLDQDLHVIPDKYQALIQKSLLFLHQNKDQFLLPDKLETYSPKFLSMLNNIINTDHIGSHLVYSQFRTLEGIGIFKIVLQANGFAQFRIKEHGKGNWLLDINEEDKHKPMFALHTGTESPEEKEIIRNIFNGSWKFIPPILAEQLTTISDNNVYGDIIKVFMITASGAEGISLKNVRYVHITEPYWHPVRTTQVIGRARRICSHQDLPEELRTVQVFIYLMTLSEKQKYSDESIELRLKDRSKIDNKTPFTSDETIFEIANLKENIVEQLLTGVKQSAMDCLIHNKEGLKCLTFTSNDPNKFSFNPSINDEDTDDVASLNKRQVKTNLTHVEIHGTKYLRKIIDKNNYELYDPDVFKQNQQLELVGRIKRTSNGDVNIEFIN